MKEPEATGSDFFRGGQNRKVEGQDIRGNALKQMRNSDSDCSVINNDE